MTLRPRLILVELTNRCNLNCVFCNHRHRTDFPEYDGSPQDMDFDLYKKIVDETTSHAWIIHPNGCGEPLLYPHIVEAIEYASERGKKTWFFTNATLLDRKMTKALLEANLTRILFSVDGCDKQSYEPFRVGASWDAVVENIAYFVETTRSGGYETMPRMRICLTPENESIEKEIVGFWHNLGIEHVRTVNEIVIPPPSEFLYPSKWSSRGMKFSCRKINRHLTVNVTGKVVLCCVDYLGAYVLGDLNKQSPLEAFNSPEAKRIRKAMETGKNYPKFCDYCPDPDRMIQMPSPLGLHSEKRPLIDLSKWRST